MTEHRAKALTEELKRVEQQLLTEQTQMRTEISQLESSIQAGKDELDRMEKQLSNKEKSALLSQVNKFFGQEVPEEYLPQIKACFNNVEQSKDLKLKLFEE